MANSAINLTGQSTGSGNIPFLLYEPIDQSKPQPVIVFLHGAGEGSPNGGPHNTTTVRTLEDSGHGIMTLTKSTSLPAFEDPVTGEEFEYFMIAPQQYYPAGTNRGNGITWPMTYITSVINWLKANRNVDESRIYLTGLSLGGGGTVAALATDGVNQLFAAAACACPGYANGSATNHTLIAESGVPLWIVAAYDDFVPQGTNTICTQIINRIHNNTSLPLRPVKFDWYLSGGHGIWYRLYDITDGRTYSGFNGINCDTPLSMFRWFLQYRRPNGLMPYYP